MSDRIRLSAKARQRLKALADQADVEPSFLLELLINKFGKTATDSLTDPKPTLYDNKEPLVTLTDTNRPKGDSKGNLEPLESVNELSPLEKIAAFDFD